MPKTKPLLFLDMDGVIVDFVTGALDALTIDLHDTDIVQDDMAKQLGLTPEQFWDAQHDDLLFWLDLDPCSGAVEFYEELTKLADVRICTSPSLHANCASHKLLWLEEHLGREARLKAIIGKDKHLLSCLGRILIDDNDKKVEAWEKEAGWAFLFPRPWNNSRHRFVSSADSYDQALHYVRTMTQ